jgi:hypothetical protein
MAFRLRRGTDTERQSVVFAEGELVYTTDTKELYVGDGHALGGIKITGSVEVSPIALTRNLDLNTFDITGAGDINISGMVTANAFYGNGANLTHLPVLDVNNGATYQINIMGADSSILVNSDTSQLQGELIGNVVGNVAGNVTGDVTGDVTGSIYNSMSELVLDSESKYFFGGVYSANGSPIIENDTKTLYGTLIGNVQGSDSTLIINSITGDINASAVNASSVDVTGIVNCGTALNVASNGGSSTLKLSRTSTVDISGTELVYGGIYFQRDDLNGPLTTALMYGTRNGIYMSADSTGVFPEITSMILNDHGKIGLGTFTPSEKLTVVGNATISGFVQFGSLTTTQRNALTAVNGMVIYNTTNHKFEGYQNGGWINLDNGATAS